MVVVTRRQCYPRSAAIFVICCNMPKAIAANDNVLITFGGLHPPALKPDMVTSILERQPIQQMIFSGLPSRVSFVKKPDRETAGKYLESREYL